jgi:hypothetical protein
MATHTAFPTALSKGIVKEIGQPEMPSPFPIPTLVD